jgi:hypothetical protein
MKVVEDREAAEALVPSISRWWISARPESPLAVRYSVAAVGEFS